jgi:tetratricopeptide (TPR) repeat protein
MTSCKPINIFGPLIDPSNMGNEAKLDAGYNALENGNYEEAIDYFTDVINSGESDVLADAYLGRASAYMHASSPHLSDVTGGLLDGTLEVDNPSQIIQSVVKDDQYETFFDNMENAAADYNEALDILGSKADAGILIEVYQSNMMAATGIGAQTIAYYWDEGGTYPGVTSEELDQICDEFSTYTYNIVTWEDSNSSNNGLRQHVDGKVIGGDDKDRAMMNYLNDAYNAVQHLKSNPPVGMTDEDLLNMQNGIKEWTYYGLNDASLGIPS